MRCRARRDRLTFPLLGKDPRREALLFAMFQGSIYAIHCDISPLSEESEELCLRSRNLSDRGLVAEMARTEVGPGQVFSLSVPLPPLRSNSPTPRMPGSRPSSDHVQLFPQTPVLHAARQASWPGHMAIYLAWLATRRRPIICGPGSTNMVIPMKRAKSNPTRSVLGRWPGLPMSPRALTADAGGGAGREAASPAHGVIQPVFPSSGPAARIIC